MEIQAWLFKGWGKDEKKKYDPADTCNIEIEVVEATTPAEPEDAKEDEKEDPKDEDEKNTHDHGYNNGFFGADH